MKKETNVIKQVIGALLALLAGVLGFETAPEMALSFGSVLLSVYVLTDLVKPYVSETLTQILSWVWGIVLSLLAWWLGLGMFADMTILFAGITGFIVSLAANGIYDSEWLESLWVLLRNMFKSKK